MSFKVSTPQGEAMMYRYEVIIYWSEEDHAYIAEVPELAGCKTFAEL